MSSRYTSRHAANSCLFPFPLSSCFEFIPSKGQGPGPDLTTWGHTHPHQTGEFHELPRTPCTCWDMSTAGGQASFAPLVLLPCVVPCGLAQPLHGHAEYLPYPLVRWRVRTQAPKCSSFPTPKPKANLFQRQRHGSADQQRWHRAANTSISDSREAAAKGKGPSK